MGSICISSQARANSWTLELSGSATQISGLDVQLHSTQREHHHLLLQDALQTQVKNLLRLHSHTPSQAHRRSQRRAPLRYKQGGLHADISKNAFAEFGFSRRQNLDDVLATSGHHSKQVDAWTSIGGAPPTQRASHYDLSYGGSHLEKETPEERSRTFGVQNMVLLSAAAGFGK